MGGLRWLAARSAAEMGIMQVLCARRAQAPAIEAHFVRQSRTELWMLVGLAWISSIEHLNRFAAIVAAATPAAKATAHYEVPPDFPATQPLWGLMGHRAPLLFFAHGHAQVDHNRFRFVAARWRPWMTRVHNLRTDLELDIPIPSIVSVESHLFTSPVGSSWDVPWLRIRTSLPGLAADFLTTAGATVTTLLTLASRRRRYAKALADAVEANGWGRRGSSSRPA